MSTTFEQVKQLVAVGKIRVSQHAYRRLVAHALRSDDVLATIAEAVVLEDYPTYFSGPAVLVLHGDVKTGPMHSVWGIEKGTSEPAVLVTVYRPDPERWSNDYRTRKP